LEKLATEPVIGLRRKDYSEYYRVLERVFASISAKPRIAVACDSVSSLITEVEAGRGIALAPTSFQLMAGKRLLYRPLTGTSELVSVGIAPCHKGRRDTCWRKILRILAANIYRSE
jgi:DNA-binding transcriptional LysR family regulator